MVQLGFGGAVTTSDSKMLEPGAFRCESRAMSTTAVREKGQTTLPADVCDAAGIAVHDQIEWRFENGEIRGRKLMVREPRTVVGKLVNRDGVLVLDTKGLTVEPEDIARAVRDERDQRNDYGHALAAKKVDADVLLTRNTEDFRGLSGSVGLEWP